MYMPLPGGVCGRRSIIVIIVCVVIPRVTLGKALVAELWARLAADASAFRIKVIACGDQILGLARTRLIARRAVAGKVAALGTLLVDALPRAVGLARNAVAAAMGPVARQAMAAAHVTSLRAWWALFVGACPLARMAANELFTARHCALLVLNSEAAAVASSACAAAKVPAGMLERTWLRAAAGRLLFVARHRNRVPAASESS